MKNKVVLYKKHQLGDKLIIALTRAYCTVFNYSHFMIHKQSNHIISLETVFGPDKVSYESMYLHPGTKSFLKKGYLFFHDPKTVAERLRKKFLTPNNKPYVWVILDAYGTILGFNFGVVYPCLLQLIVQEGWSDRFYYAGSPLFGGIETRGKQARHIEKLMVNIQKAINFTEKYYQPTDPSIKQIHPGCHFFSPNALGVLPEFEGNGLSSLLNYNLFHSLEVEDRRLPFLFETTVGDKTHRVLKQIGCVVADGTLANPNQEIAGKGDSVVMVGNQTVMIDCFLPLLKTA